MCWKQWKILIEIFTFIVTLLGIVIRSATILMLVFNWTEIFNSEGILMGDKAFWNNYISMIMQGLTVK